MSNFVFLIDANKTPMNPIHPAHARKLLAQGKAAVFRRYPFVLIMNRVVENIVTYRLSLRSDPGSKFTGISLVNNRDEVIWGMELKHRGQTITDALKSRASVRRNRRASKTRYRQPRFLNRAASTRKGKLPPSLMSRVYNIDTWVKRLIQFSPVAEIRQELVGFDLQKMETPEISGVEYQQGTLAGYEVREYLLEKWGRKCAYCNAEDTPLQIEHIVPKANRGSNRISNLTIACEKCNKKKGDKDIKVFLKRKPEVLKKVLAQAKNPLKDATAVNSTRWKLFMSLKTLGLSVLTGSGGRTKFNRTRLALPKQHWIDSACVGIVDKLTILTSKILRVTATGFGGRQRCQTNKFGYPIKHRPLRPIHGFSTGDIVRAEVPRGKYKGTFTARVCPMSDSRGEFVIDKKRFSIKLDYCTTVHHKDGYSYT